MPVPWKDGVRYIAGGSFIGAPVNAFGIKLAPEVSVAGDIELEITDYGVPKNKEMFLHALWSSLEVLNENEPVYAGCFAGVGRTGMFFGALVRALGVDDPLNYVRTYYHPRAIETQEQYDFVMDLDLRELNKKFGVSTLDGYKWSEMGESKNILELCKEMPVQWESVLEEFGFFKKPGNSNEFEEVNNVFGNLNDSYYYHSNKSNVGAMEGAALEQGSDMQKQIDEQNFGKKQSDAPQSEQYVVGVQKRRL